VQSYWPRKIKTINKVGLVIALVCFLLFSNLGGVDQQIRRAEFYTSLGMYDSAAKTYEEVLKQNVLSDFGKAFVYWAAAQSWHRVGNVDNAATDYLGFLAYAQDINPEHDFYIDSQIDSKLKYSRIMLLGFWMSKAKTSCVEEDLSCEISSIVDIQVLEKLVPFCEGNLNQTLIKEDNNLFTVKAVCNNSTVEKYYFYSYE